MKLFNSFLLALIACFAIVTTTYANTPAETTICTMEYAPVCGMPVFECPEGAACMEPLPVTYSNKCMLNGAGAKYLYEWECKKEGEKTQEKACTREYMPVCGKLYKVCTGPGCGEVFKTYSNKCVMENDGAQFVSSGECDKVEKPALPEPTESKYYVADTEGCTMIKYRCEKWWNYFGDDIGCGCQKQHLIDDEMLSDAVKERLNTAVEKFITRLEAKDYSDKKMLEVIDAVIVKLEAIKAEKYKYLVKYVIYLLEIEKWKYETDINIVEDIFKKY